MIREENKGALPEKNVLKDRVGRAFSEEARQRLGSRHKGFVDRATLWNFKQELFAYGLALVGVVELPPVDKIQFDRVIDSIIEDHNVAVGKERSARAASIKKPVSEVAQSGKPDYKYKHAKPPTRGEVLEA